MIDRFLATIGQIKLPSIGTQFDTSLAVRERFFDTQNSQLPTRLVVVFGFWHAPERMLLSLVQRLNKQNAAVLLYELHPDILSYTPALVKQSFEHVAKAAEKRVTEIASNKQYSDVDLLGFSLGNVPLCLLAEKCAFDNATLVLPGSDLAKCLWDGSRTQRLKQAYSSNGIQLSQLTVAWQSLAPASHVKAFTGHPVYVVLSTHDTFIPYSSGLKLVHQFRTQGIQPKLTTYKFGAHALTISRFISRL